LESEKNYAESGIGISGALSITLIILKAFEKIDMSWFWVISSFVWIPLILFVLVASVVFVIGLVVIYLEKKGKL